MEVLLRGALFKRIRMRHCVSIVVQAAVLRKNALFHNTLGGGSTRHVPAVLRRRMSVDEAGKILEVDVNSVTEAEMLAVRFSLSLSCCFSATHFLAV